MSDYLWTAFLWCAGIWLAALVLLCICFLSAAVIVERQYKHMKQMDFDPGHDGLGGNDAKDY